MDAWSHYLENPDLLNRAKCEQLEGILGTLPWIATVDAFQHWIYENPAHTNEERTSKWNEILLEFKDDVIDYSGLENYRSNAWLRQLHLFEVPFYYIEYGIAQLGAIGMWMQYQKNPTLALENYMNALSLGGTKTLPELYQTAGISFDFSSNYVKTLMDFTRDELEKLYQ